ncbi:MAG: M28 family peptidase [Flavobacteriaceae bacterium]|nr:M28 family peptidase [Flavobacteriaceae bacterium]
MNKLSILLAFGIAFSCNSSKEANQAVVTQQIEPKSVEDFAATITSEDLKTHLYIYASDEFEGRETGKPGQKKAVNYLRSHYQKFNIPHPESLQTYFQPVPLVLNKLPEASFHTENQSFVLGEDFVPVGASQDLSLNNAELVFAGYGIESPAYSDYTGLDVKGKIVLVRAGEPKLADGTYVVSGTKEPSEWSNFRPANRARMEVAKQKGALGILVMDKNYWPRLSSRFQYTKRLAATGGGSISLTGNVDSFFNWYLSENAAKAIFSDIEKASASAKVVENANISLTNDTETVDSENVIAYVKGTEFPDEYVVISSHLDHIGIAPDGQINNGADDDGSGTVAVLEIAEAFSKAVASGYRPKRSVVFLNVTGEEKGLLGSEYYSQNPVFPMENTVADLNIDMIGRTDPKRSGSDNYVYLIGSDKLSSELHQLSEEVNKKYVNIELDYTYNDENDPNQFYYRSDHYNFAKHNVPIIFYFNGTHEDYHKVSDTPDKIRYDLLETRARLVFHTAWEIANRDKRLVVDKPAP